MYCMLKGFKEVQQFRMDRAADYGAATDRVNKALATLKAELMELRIQDVELMKQLITINDTIRELTPKKDHKVKRKNHFYSSTRGSCFGLHMLPDGNSSETSLLRQQSAPNFSNLRRESNSSVCSSNVSLGSIEDINCSMDDVIFEMGSDVEDYFTNNDDTVSEEMYNEDSEVSGFHRAKSFCVVPKRSVTTHDSCYEDILMSNVKLWKYAQNSGKSKAESNDVCLNR